MATPNAVVRFAKAFVQRGDDQELPASFVDVRRAEEAAIQDSRDVRYDGNDPLRTRPAAYVGISLSGGGIRSATFSLGLLQALERLGVLRTADYLSTVSGGGFTGGWWSAWLSRPDTAGYFPPAETRELERAPDYTRAERLCDGARFAGEDPVHHVRLFANYLTPRKGLLSSDTWRAAAVVSRNLILTWLILLPILCTLVLVGQLYFVVQPFDDAVVEEFVHRDVEGADDDALHTLAGDQVVARLKVAARPIVALVALLVWVAALWMHYNNAGTPLTHLANIVALLLVVGATAVAVHPGLLDGAAMSAGRGLLSWDGALVTLTVVAGAAIFFQIRHDRSPDAAVARQARGNRATRWHGRVLATLVMAAFVLGFAGFAHDFFISAVDHLSGFNVTDWKDVLVAVTTVLGVLGTLFTVLRSVPTGGRDAREVARPSAASCAVFALTPPLVLMILAAGAAVLMHRALYHTLQSADRTTSLSVAAFAGLALAVFLAAWENEKITPADRLSRVDIAVPVVLLIAAAAYSFTTPAMTTRVVGIAVAAIVVARAIAARRRNVSVRTLVAFATGTLLTWMVVSLPAFDAVWSSGESPYRKVPLTAGIVIFAALGGWVVALGWMADPNALALHTFYKARLIRAYLGASNRRRRAQDHEIAEPDTHDDVRLCDVDTGARGGPYHLVNATLNLVGGRDLITAQRSAAHFVLAPKYCGSVRTGYRPTEDYMSGRLTLGAAIAASGAAMSPTMGGVTPSAAQVLLLAAMNVRLGLWVPTPSRSAWRMSQTHFWPYYLLRESLSQTNDLASFCYLTDGGHFDNTGLYALVERGCRFIVVSDNGAEPNPGEPCFADIGEAIRKCRIDFRAEIALDTRVFRPADGTRGAVHFATGTIDYDVEHLRSLGWSTGELMHRTGRIVWIKPTVLPNDPGDIRQYGLENPAFPQQSTADQWFDESQFESYRKLGELSALATFGKALQTAPLGPKLTVGAVQRLFDNV